MLLHTAVSIECFWSTPFRAHHTGFMHCTPLWYYRVCVSFNNGTTLFILHCYDTMLHNTQCLLLLHTAVSIEWFWSTPFRAHHTGYILDINIRKVDTACNCCILTTTSSLTHTTRGNMTLFLYAWPNVNRFWRVTSTLFWKDVVGSWWSCLWWNMWYVSCAARQTLVKSVWPW